MDLTLRFFGQDRTWDPWTSIFPVSAAINVAFNTQHCNTLQHTATHCNNLQRHAALMNAAFITL